MDELKRGWIIACLCFRLLFGYDGTVSGCREYYSSIPYVDKM